MTKFFVPLADTDENRDKVYDAIRKFARETIGWKQTDRKIFSIKFTHNGRQHEESVGQKAQNGEIVFAILETDTVYLVCTPHRGVLGGEPMLVGKHDTISIVDFDK